MANYIIDPKTFYLINVSEKISIILTVLFALCTLISLIAIFICMGELDMELEDDKKTFKKVVVAFFIFLILLILTQLLPDRQTGYAMIAAKLITEENIQPIEEIKEIVDYIAGAFA